MTNYYVDDKSFVVMALLRTISCSISSFCVLQKIPRHGVLFLYTVVVYLLFSIEEDRLLAVAVTYLLLCASTTEEQ